MDVKMNSKMERQLNSKSDKQSIYEIFRACRLCGAGGGYKMPIIQSIPLDVDEDVELRQKIRDCVQIEVRQNDKMPPLICELCMDKINDFYEFLEMCRQTNKKTRLRLGLPPQTLPRGAPDAEDCILGVTEPVFINEDSNDVPLSKQKAKIKTEKLEKNEKNKKVEPSSKSKRKRSPSPEPKVVITRRSLKVESTRPTRQSESGRPHRDAKVGSVRGQKTRSPSPPPRRITRKQIEEKEESMKLSRLTSQKQPPNKETKQVIRHTRFSGSSSNSSKDNAPKGILKIKKEDSFVKPKELGKRTREKEQQKDVPLKKVKIAIKPVPPAPPKQERRTTAPPPRAERRRAATPPPPPAPPARRPGPASKVRRCSPVATPETHKCNICGSTFVKYGTLVSHMRTHTPTHTSNRLACNACREWFTTSEEAAIHHRWHRISSTPYRCEYCNSDYRNQNAYNEHFEAESCHPFVELPELKCESCWGLYPTQNLLDQHRCPGQDGRPGGKCFKCLRTYATARTLKKHEESCRAKKMGDINVSPDVVACLRKVQVLFARCDPLLERRPTDDGSYDVSGVDEMYGLSKNFEYPYLTSARNVRIKMELEELDGMVNIKDDLLHLDDTYVHWDSDDSDSSVEEVEASEESKLVTSPFAGGKKTPRVQSLARLSIRSIFSNRFLGKVPKRKRKFKFENLPRETDFDSITDKNLDLNDEVLNRKNKSHESSLIESDSSKNDDSQMTNNTEEESLVEVNKENICDMTESSSKKLVVEHVDGTQRSDEIDLSVEKVGNDNECDTVGNDAEKKVTEHLDKSQKSSISPEECAEDTSKTNETVIAVKVSTENIETEEREDSKLNENKVTDRIKDVEHHMGGNGNVDGVEEELERENESKSKADEQNKLDKKTLDIDEGTSEVKVKDVSDQDENLEISETTCSNVADRSEEKGYESLVEHHEDEKESKDTIEGDTLHNEMSSEIEPETKLKENDSHKENIENSQENNVCDAPNTTELEETTYNKNVENSNDLGISVKNSYKLDSNSDNTNNRTDISGISESVNLTYEKEKEKSFPGNVSSDLDKISDDELNVSDTELDDKKLLDELDEQIEQRNSGEQSRVEENSKEGYYDNDKNSGHDEGVFVNEEDSRKDLEDNRETSFASSQVVEENSQSDVQNSTDNETSSRSDFTKPKETKTYAAENSDDVGNVTEDYIKDRRNSKEVEMKTNLENLTSNSNSLDGSDKCSETITQERENFLLEDKSEHLLNEEDIITSKTDRSMDLDNISDDDFNFDS